MNDNHVSPVKPVTGQCPPLGSSHAERTPTGLSTPGTTAVSVQTRFLGLRFFRPAPSRPWRGQTRQPDLLWRVLSSVWVSLVL
jgi:hypothetical protein